MPKDQKEEKKCENGCDENHVCSKCACKKCKTMNLETMKCDCSSTLDEWEEKFDKLHTHCLDLKCNFCSIRGIIKSFIRQLLSKKDAEIRESISNLRLQQKSLIDIGSEFATPRDYRRSGYNQALEDLLAKLDNHEQ